MLKLFQTIFGGNEVQGRYPESLIEAATERAVDATDPRLRVLSGYRKKLRSAVIHAIDHVVGLVDSLPVPIDLTRANCDADPELVAYLGSFAHAQELLSLDPVLSKWRGSPVSTEAQHIVMLLLMEQRERHVFGVELEGDMLRRDVPQTTVSFAQHRLVDPTAAEEETRRALKRRALDHLLSLALGRIAAAHAERAGLEQERHLLQRKCTALAAGRWGFDEAGGDASPDPQALQRQLEEIESQLKALGAGPELLKVHLDIVADVLTQAEHNLWLAHSPLVVNRMGVKQAHASALVPEINLAVLHNAAGRNLVARLVGIARTDLPPQRDLLRELQSSRG
jgi:hypothetical protein